MKISWFSKLHPNEKLRNWSKARTFGGTTKEKSLYIMGLRRKTFFLVASGVSILVLAIGVGGGLGLHFFIQGLKNDSDLTGIVVGITTTYTREDGIVTTEVRSSTSILGGGGGDGSQTSSSAGQSSSTSNTITSSASSTSSSISSSTTSSAGGGGDPPPDGEFFKGEGTFYAPGIGSCGFESTDAEFVAALSRILFDADNNGNANNNPNCNRKIFIKNPAGSRKRGLDAWSVSNHSDGIWNFGSTIGGSTNSVTPLLSRNGSLLMGASRPEPDLSFHNSTYSFSTPTEAQSSSSIVCAQNSTANGYRFRYGHYSQPSRKYEHNDTTPQCERNKRLVAKDHSASRTRKESTTPPPRHYYHQTKLAVTLNEVVTPPVMRPTPPPIKLQDRQVGNGGITITVVDRCPACAQYDLDLAPAAFNVIGDPDVGRIDIEWRWLD